MTRFYSLATRLLFPLRNPLWEAFIQLLSSFLSPCTNSDFAKPAWGLLWTLALNVSDNDNVHLNIIYIFLMPCLFKQIMNRRQKVQPWQDYKYVYLTMKASSFISSHRWFEFILSGPVTLTVQATLHTVMTSAFCNKGISKKKKKKERGREEERREEKSGEREEKERKKTKRSRGVNLAGGKRNETLQCFSYRLRLQGRASSWWPLTDMGPGWQIPFSAWMAREEPVCALLVIQVMCFICFPWDGKNYVTYSRGAWNDWWYCHVVSLGLVY